MTRLVIYFAIIACAGCQAEEISAKYRALTLFDQSEQAAYNKERINQLGISAYMKRESPIEHLGEIWRHDYLRFEIMRNLPETREAKIELISLWVTSDPLVKYSVILALNYSASKPLLLRSKSIWMRGLSPEQLNRFSEILSQDLERNITLE